MNDDLISRQAVLDMLDDINNHIIDGYGYKHDWCVEWVKGLSSIEQERKTGRWILYENQRKEDVDNGNYLYICSECGKSDLHAKTQKVSFCWNCGTRMDGEENG